MNSINSFGLKVSLITTVIVLLVVAAVWGIHTWFTSRQLAETATPPTNTEQDSPLLLDADEDGLPDALESVYNTDPNNPDTDGDGVFDGDEIALGKNPTVAGPDDQIETALTPESTVPLSTYTSRYFATLPSESSRETIFDSDRLDAFVEQARQPVLEPLVEGTVRILSDSSPAAVETYIQSLSPQNNPNLRPFSLADIDTAITAASSEETQAKLAEIISTLDHNVSTLESIEVPPVAKGVHTKLITATRSASKNTNLIKNATEDPVGALVGAKNIEELHTIFQSISSELAALQPTS